jgi:hypothetical protein
MSTVNRLKQKKKTIDQPSDTAPQTNSNVYPNYSAEKKSKTYNASNHSE